MSQRTALAAFTCCVLMGRTAYAQDAPVHLPAVTVAVPVAAAPVLTEDQVMLEGGAVLRGRVTAMRVDAMSLTMRTTGGRDEQVAWSNIRASSGPSFPVSYAQVELPGPYDAVVRFVSTRRQYVEATWGQVTASPDGALTGGKLYRARCMAPCSMSVPVGRVLLAVEHGGTNGRHARVLFVPESGVTVRVNAPAETIATPLVVAGSVILATGASVAMGLLATDPQMSRPEMQTGMRVAVSASVGGLMLTTVGSAIATANPRGFALRDEARVPSQRSPYVPFGATPTYQDAR